jgi:hypothetical protein
VTIGDVTMELKDVQQPQLVPHNYSPAQFTQEELGHLRWLMQKDKLQQEP